MKDEKLDFLIKQDSVLQSLKFYLKQQETELNRQYKTCNVEFDKQIIDAFLTTIICVEDKIKVLEEGK